MRNFMYVFIDEQYSKRVSEMPLLESNIFKSTAQVRQNARFLTMLGRLLAAAFATSLGAVLAAYGTARVGRASDLG